MALTRDGQPLRYDCRSRFTSRALYVIPSLYGHVALLVKRPVVGQDWFICGGFEHLMRKTSTSLILVGLVALLALAACGGGSSNKAPVANAGMAQSVASGATVFLNGSGSRDSDGSIAAYQWTQTAGTPVSLQDATSVQASFDAPTVSVATSLNFSLVVTDDKGGKSAAASVTVTVNPPTVTLAGTVRYSRVPIVLSPVPRLDYPGSTFQPSRGVVVRVLNAGTQAVLASGVTLDDGTYSLQVPGNTSVTIQVEARLLRDSAQPLPRWNVRVQDGTGSTLTPYRYTSAVFNSSSGNGDVDIPLGINSSGAATGVRASGPFAILDTIYTALQAATAPLVMPTANFPALYVDWGTQSDGTYFTLNAGAHIALMADLSEDTDEFDPAVIAHEFGHYMQSIFSRSDSIGGNHGLGDTLDLRVAFNEGFATAFATIALNDPIYIDTFVQNGSLVAGGYSVEANPATNPPANGLGLGCWCNEASVGSLVWDLDDANIDGSDGVELGFAPIWQAMLGSTSTTPSFVSIFSFIRSLKAIRPVEAGAIDTLVAAQNIDSATIDDFATNETHSPLNNVLPVYTSIVKGTPVVVHSIDDGGPNATDGDGNKLGAHAFLRYVAQSTGTVSITLTTSNPDVNRDPDFQMYRSGVQILPGAVGQSDSSNAEHNEVASGISVTSGTTYIIDAYDCANGCSTAQGIPGDYDLTVLIQ
jgi:hypothetical protein